MSVGRDGASDAVLLRVPGRAGGRVLAARGRGITGPRSGSRFPRLHRQTLDTFLAASSPSPLNSRAETGLNKPPPSGDHEPAPKPKRFWWRFTLKLLIIVLVSAAATATVILRYVDSIAKALSHNNVLQNKVEKFLSKTHGREAGNTSTSAPTSGPANPAIP